MSAEIQQCKPGDYVKTGGQLLRIKSIWGVSPEGYLASPKQGGFGVITESDQRIGMMEAQSYHLASDIDGPPAVVWNVGDLVITPDGYHGLVSDPVQKCVFQGNGLDARLSDDEWQKLVPVPMKVGETNSRANFLGFERTQPGSMFAGLLSETTLRDIARERGKANE